MKARLLPLLIPPVLFLLCACGSADPEVHDHKFSFSWSLVEDLNADPHKDPPITCQDAGVAYIGLAFKQTSNGLISPFEIPCAQSGTTMTALFPDDYYDVAAACLDSAKMPITSIILQAQNIGTYKDLGTIIFPLHRR